MANPLVVKTYQHPSLSFEVPFTPEGYFNATIAGKAFGKMPKDWLKTADAQEYIQAVVRKCTTKENQSVIGESSNRRKILLEQDQLVIVKNGAPETGGGTWLHPKLGIVFARWLNVDFALWCDEQIDAILHGRHPQSQPATRPVCSPEQWEVIDRLIHGISTCCKFHGKASFAANERIRFGYGLRNSRDLPPEHFEEVKSELEGLQELAEQHQNRVIALEEEFVTAVIRPPVSIRKVRAMAKKAVSHPLSF